MKCEVTVSIRDAIEAGDNLKQLLTDRSGLRPISVSALDMVRVRGEDEVTFQLDFEPTWWA